jgi:hypothetical protein
MSKSVERNSYTSVAALEVAEAGHGAEAHHHRQAALATHFHRLQAMAAWKAAAGLPV